MFKVEVLFIGDGRRLAAHGLDSLWAMRMRLGRRGLGNGLGRLLLRRRSRLLVHYLEVGVEGHRFRHENRRLALRALHLLARGAVRGVQLGFATRTGDRDWHDGSGMKKSSVANHGFTD